MRSAGHVIRPVDPDAHSRRSRYGLLCEHADQAKPCAAESSPMKADHIIRIDAPPSLVWQVTTDIDRWPDWTPTVDEARRLDDGPFTLGGLERRRYGKPSGFRSPRRVGFSALATYGAGYQTGHRSGECWPQTILRSQGLRFPKRRFPVNEGAYRHAVL